MQRPIILVFVVFCSLLPGQDTWTGAVSSAWGVAGNWSGGVPTGSSDVVIPSGTPNSPSTSGASSPVCRDLTVDAGATLTIASGFRIDANRSITVNGTITGTGGLRLVGAAAVNLSGAGTLGTGLELAKTAGASVLLTSNLSLNGGFTQTSGDIFASAGFAQTLTVTGNALFQGGSLAVSGNTGIIDVAGSVTFAGTDATGNLPTLRCAGNWTADANFAPVAGLVELDGSGAQAISGTGTFKNLTIASGSITSASNLTVNGALIANGSLAVSGTLDANGNVTVGGSGALNVGGGTDTFAGSLTVNGTFASTGTVVFDDSTSGTLSSTSPLASVQIAKVGGAGLTLGSDVTVGGSFTQTSGNFFASVASGQTLTVTGSALFQGGSLAVSGNTGTIDVAGSVTFAGTDATGNLPTLRCGGNWTADANFAPAAGLVELDGSGAQAISGTTTFKNLTIASGSITSTSNLTVNGALIANGSLAVSGTLDANGNVTVGGSGALNVGGGTDTFASSLIVNGTFASTGTVVFDDTIAATLSSASPLPNVQIAKVGAAVTLASDVTVNGNLTETSGTLALSIGSGQTLTVTGNALFQGGSFGVSTNTGILDIAGNVTFAGTIVTGTMPPIRCAGNWTADANFAPASGTVELDGTSTTTIAHATPGGTLHFAGLVIKNGTRTVANDFTVAAGSVTIDPGATLQIAGGRHEHVHSVSGATAFAVNGTLSVAANAELSMGPQTSMAVGATGALSLVGTAAQPARITGEAGGGYALTVNGALAAKDFVVKEMGPGGFVIGLGAAIAAAPNDFRNGTLDFSAGAAAGSVLLDVRRNVPAILDQLTFLNTPGAAGVFNVKTDPSSVPVSLTNWTGAFAGPAFETDPGNLITWNTQTPPIIASFAAIPGAELAEVVWHMTNELNVASYQVRRASSAAGPFPVIHTGSAGVVNYGIVDQPLPANQAELYLLYANLSGGDSVLLANGATTPYSASPPPNVYKVGGNGPFATIQAAINAATDAHSVVWVTPGSYGSFAIGATAPSNLHVIAEEGPNQVTIDTSSGPIQISNVAASGGVELSNLVVGNAGAAQDGIVIANCAAPVVLDEVSVSCDSAHVAVQVTGSQAIAIQRCPITGGTGLSVSAASHVAISRGSLSSLVSTNSTIEMTSLTPGSVSVTPAPSLTTRSGLMPNLNLPELVKLSQPGALFLDAFPNAPYIVIASPRLGFTTVNPFEMPVLIDQVGMAQLPIQFTDPLGQGTIGFEVPPNASLLGFTYVVQAGVFDPSSNNWRFSNVETMVGMP